MSSTTGAGESVETAIVVHGPLSGEQQRIDGLSEEHRMGAALRAPTITNALPPGIQDPLVRRAEMAEHAAQQQVRVFGLDAVRGLSLLAMNLTFALPAVMLLPAWMYHMQNPPPNGAYVPLPGLTWQDIIFPGFLFAMAAAIPIRGSHLLASGEPEPSIIWGSLKRTALLYVFSLIIAHVNPFFTKDYSRTGNLVAIAGFLTCFALFIRRRPDWNPTAFAWLRRAGWVAAAFILFVLPVTWGATFSPMRRDNIITSIAFIYFVGSVIWLLTRERPAIRVVIMLGVALLKVLSPVVDTVATFWGSTALPWIYDAWYFDLLLIALPGTIAGDLLVRWTRFTPDDRTLRDHALSVWRLVGVAALGLLAPVVLLVGLYQRLLLATTIATLGIVAAGAWLLSRFRSERDRLLARIGTLAGVPLVAGILLEPLEGGVKKDPQTVSFLLLCAGMWLGLLLSATIIVDVLRGTARRLAEPVILAGQNAMLAYVIFNLFFNHIAYYFRFGNFLSATPAESALRGALVTAFVMATIWAATRNRIVWRS